MVCASYSEILEFDMIFRTAILVYISKHVETEINFIINSSLNDILIPGLSQRDWGNHGFQETS